MATHAPITGRNGARPFHLTPLQRRKTERAIEALLGLLDFDEGDSDLEDGDEDACSAREDDAARFSRGKIGFDDPRDAACEDKEDGHDLELTNEDGTDQNDLPYWER